MKDSIITADYPYTPESHKQVTVGRTVKIVGSTYVFLSAEDASKNDFVVLHFSPKRARKLAKKLKKAAGKAEQTPIPISETPQYTPQVGDRVRITVNESRGGRPDMFGRIGIIERCPNVEVAWYLVRQVDGRVDGEYYYAAEDLEPYAPMIGDRIELSGTSMGGMNLDLRNVAGTITEIGNPSLSGINVAPFGKNEMYVALDQRIQGVTKTLVHTDQIFRVLKGINRREAS